MARSSAAGWSLRNRLIASLVAAALLAWGASAVWLVHEARAEAGRLADAALVETAHLVMALARAGGGDEDPSRGRQRGRGRDDDVELPAIDALEHRHSERLYYQLRDARGTLLLRSPGAPSTALAAADGSGLGDARVDGAPWRVYTLRDDASGLVLHVGEPGAQRAAFARAAWLRLAAPGLALIVALVAATVWITRRALRPVERAAHAIDAAAPGDRSAIANAGLPREIEPLAHAIDRLQSRVERALLHERTLTADAAHELRTPLAALRAQAQWAARAPEDAARERALADVVLASDRCARLVDAVLTLARLDAARFDRATLPATDLGQVAQLVLDEFSAAAARRGVALAASLAPITVRADADAIAVALRNLVDNALRHASTRVDVALTADAGNARLTVRDDGAGSDEADLDRLFERFYRAPGTGGHGSGLGLALVRRVAQLHGGRASADRSTVGRGLAFTLALPLA